MTEKTTEAYVDGLCKSMQAIRNGSPIKSTATRKRKLAELLNENSDSGNEESVTLPFTKRTIINSSSDED